MFKVFIDTCVWFDIAEEPKRFPELAVIEEMTRRGTMQLIVPRLAVEEFHRKRQNIAQASGTDLLPHIRAVREAVLKLGGPQKRQQAFLAQLDEVATHGPIQGAAVRQALDRIERLLLGSAIIEKSDAVIHAAVERGLNKLAPFHTRNGMGDAILVETYAQCVRDGGPDKRFVFVTHNKKDFSVTQGNENLPHPHLVDIFSTDRSFYFIDLLAALNLIEPQIVKDVIARNQPTVGTAIEQYLTSGVEIHPSFRHRLRSLSGEEIAKKQVSKLRPSDFIEHAKARRKTVEPSTVLQDFVALKGAFTWAQTHNSADISLETLERAKQDALKQGLIAKSRVAPVRRLSREDEQRLIQAFVERQKDRRNVIDMVALIQFALWSGRRRDEMLRLRWEDFHRESSSCVLRDVGKTNKRVRFPLLGKALETVIKQQKVTGHGELIFPYKSGSVSMAFTGVKSDLNIDIAFDDLREEGIRRLLEAREYPFELIQQLEPKKVLEIQAQLESGKAI